MISLSILGMTGWVNPLRVAVRRPWTLSVVRRRSAGAFFVGTPVLVRHPFRLIIQRKPLNLDGPIGGCSPPEERLAGGCTPPAFSSFLLQSAVKSTESQRLPEGGEKTQHLDMTEIIL